MKTRQTASDRMLEEVKRSVFQYALFRPESAIVIALGILCAGASLVFPWFPGAWWLWLGFAALGEGALVLSTLKDEKFHRWVMDRIFRERFDVSRISLPELRQKAQKALDYRELIVQENMRYARRQRLWFQKESGIQWVAGPGESPKAAEAAAACVSAFLGGVSRAAGDETVPSPLASVGDA